MDKKILAVIPARKGSKGIPHKNFKKLCGKPLIDYTIKSAEKSKNISKLVISTDENKIKDYIKNKNIDIHQRPAYLSGDSTPMLPVIKYSIETEEKKYNFYDYVLILQPTCPLRETSEIDQAVEKIVSSKADSLVSVYKVEDEHPGRMYKTQDEQLFPLYPNLISLNRQDLPDIFHRNGSIYISKVDIIKNGSIYGDKIQKFEMSKTQSINIDDEIDWKLAEIILNEKNKKI